MLDLFSLDFFDSRSSLGLLLSIANRCCNGLATLGLTLGSFLLVLELNPSLLESFALGRELLFVLLAILGVKVEHLVDIRNKHSVR